MTTVTEESATGAAETMVSNQFSFTHKLLLCFGVNLVTITTLDTVAALHCTEIIGVN